MAQRVWVSRLSPICPWPPTFSQASVKPVGMQLLRRIAERSRSLLLPSSALGAGGRINAGLLKRQKVSSDAEQKRQTTSSRGADQVRVRSPTAHLFQEFNLTLCSRQYFGGEVYNWKTYPALVGSK